MRKKEARQVKQELINKYPKALDLIQKCDEVVVVEEGELKVLVINEIPAFKQHENTYIPTLLLIKLKYRDLIPKAVVDEGAVKHIINGADVMAPGIVEIDDVEENELISIWEPRKETPIAIGKTLTNSKTIKELRKGKAIKNIHHVGDKLWNLTLKIYVKTI